MPTLFEILKRWEDATDEEVIALKKAIEPEIEHIHPIPFEHMKIDCGEYLKNRVYDIFIFDDREKKREYERLETTEWPLLFQFYVYVGDPNTLHLPSDGDYRYNDDFFIEGPAEAVLSE